MRPTVEPLPSRRLAGDTRPSFAASRVAAVGLLLVFGCSSRTPDDHAPLAIEPAPLPAVPAAAQAAYDERCAQCHGTAGRGDGPLAQGLAPRPRDLRDRLWQSNVSNQHLRRVIVGGGGAVGKSQAMPAHPQFGRDPALLDGLVTRVRGFCAPQ